jgi:hydroxypyruvate reductase
MMPDHIHRRRALLRALYDAAVAAVHPAQRLPAFLPPVPAEGRVVLLAGGKAGGSMMAAAERFYLEAGLPPERLIGLGIARHGYEGPARHVPVLGAGHPMPDEAGLAATERLLALADTVQPQDTAIVLISGGGSANWIAPAAGFSLAEKQAMTRQLLRSGAPIGAINGLRKHLSRIKGGRLAARLQAHRIVTLAISDVPGDDPSTIASGPTVPDPTTLAEARAVVERYGVTLPPAAMALLHDPANETPKPGDALFARTSFHIISRPVDALEAAKAAAEAAGYAVLSLGPDVEGEAREVAAEHARLALAARNEGRRSIILSGGELTVTIRGKGRGGPSQEYALTLLQALAGTPGIAALAGDTDGTDGGGGDPDDPAGAFVDETSPARAAALGLDVAAHLANNNSTPFFAALGDLLSTGPTLTNANDLRAIVIDA